MFKRGQFMINGHHSEEFGVFMTKRPPKLAATRVIELRERVGNDSIVIDKAYYKNLERSIDCYYKAPSLDLVQEYEDQITAWLDMSGYSDFAAYFDEQYIYQAVVISPPSFTGTRRNGNIVPFSFKVSIRPFKENHVGRLALLNKTKLFNTEKYPALPVIKLTGRGDASFWVNGTEYKLKGLDRELIIDSKLEESYRTLDGNVEHQDRVTLFDDFPVLPPGQIDMSWSSNIQKFEIIPGWRRKV